MKRAGLQLNNELDAAVLAGDESRAMDIVDRGVAAGVLLPEQGVAAKVRVQQTLKERAEQTDIIEDPKTWSENNPPDKVPPGTDPARYQQMQDFAKGQMRKKTYEASAGIMDGIVSGQITTEEQIDELTQDIRPTAVEELKNGLRMRQADGYKEKVASRDYQAQVYGQLSIAIGGFKPDAEDADARIALIDRMMRDLKPGFLKQKLTDKFKNLESPDVTDDAKNYGDFVLKQVDELGKTDRFGKTVKPEEIPLKDVAPGFMKDPEKLQRGGFTKAHAEEIAALAAKDPAAAQRLLADSWNDKKLRPGGSLNASKIENDTFYALRNGRATIPWSSEESKKAADATNSATATAFGKAKMQMEDYLRLNPTDPPAKIDAAFLRITGESIKEEAKQKVIPKKPVRSEETSMNGPGVNPNVSKLWGMVTAKYPSVENWGIWGDEKHKARKSDHNTGDAIDIAIKGNDGAKVTADIVANAKANNVKYMIHNGRIWKPTTGWQAYSGSDAHNEHVHVSFNREIS